jgi:hypothetical protein
MLGRALIFATVMLLVAGVAANSAHAQPTNLEAGKSPSQIFAGTCSGCHKSPRGLLKSVSASALPGFLRQHYTTSSDMASVLASYVVSNGAGDTRYQGQTKRGTDARQQEAARPAAAPEQARPSRRFLFPWSSSEPAPEAAKPDADGLNPPAEGRRRGRSAKRTPQPSEAAPDASPEQAAEPRPGPRQKLGKRGKPSEEVGPAKQSEPARDETPKDDAAKIDSGKVDKPSESARPAPESKPNAAKADVPKESGSSESAPLRPDPVPAVTPALPAAAAAPSAPEPSASPSEAPAASTSK